MHGYKQAWFDEDGYFVSFDVSLKDEAVYLRDYLDKQEEVKNVKIQSLHSTYRVNAQVDTKKEAQALHERTVKELEIK